MRDFRDAKAMAQTLREALKEKSVSLTHSESLELVAKTLGCHDWNVLAARIQSAGQADISPVGRAVPVPHAMPLPTVPLRDLVLFPRSIVPLFVGREKSRLAIEAAMGGDMRILAVTQRRSADDDPTPDALYRVGVTANIIHQRTLADRNVKVLVEAFERVVIERFVGGRFLAADTVPIVDQHADAAEAITLSRGAFDAYRARISSSAPPHAFAHLAHIEEPGALADALTQLLPFSIEEKQDLLETTDVIARLTKILDLMNADRPPG
jgi:ATP-dependent Lon protease